MKLLLPSFHWTSLTQRCSELRLPFCATQFLQSQSSFTDQYLCLSCPPITPSLQFLAPVHNSDRCPITVSYPLIQRWILHLCTCPACWVFLWLNKPSQVHMTQNLMSKHLRISSNHGTKSLVIPIHLANCILFTASCSRSLSHLPIQLFPPSIVISNGTLK